jgi:GDP-D-mannose 3',5'-epimerase
MGRRLQTPSSRVDLRERSGCDQALEVEGAFDEVYRLAADMGGMGFIESLSARSCETTRSSTST